MLEKIANFKRERVTKYLTKADILGQLAEEAAEVSQAALKLQRIEVQNNLPEMAPPEAWDHLQEEVSDLFLVLDILEVYPSDEIMNAKAGRWADRLENQWERLA